MKEGPPAGGFGDPQRTGDLAPGPGVGLGPVTEIDSPPNTNSHPGRSSSRAQAVLVALGWICLVPSTLLMLLVTVGSLITLSVKCGDPNGPSHEASRAVMLLLMLGFYILPALPAYLLLTRRNGTTPGAVGGFLFSIFAMLTSVFCLFLGAVSHMC